MGQTAGLPPRKGWPWGQRRPGTQHQRSILSLPSYPPPSPLQPKNSLSVATRDTARNATAGGSLSSSSRRVAGCYSQLRHIQDTSLCPNKPVSFMQVAVPLEEGASAEAPVIGRQGAICAVGHTDSPSAGTLQVCVPRPLCVGPAPITSQMRPSMFREANVSPGKMPPSLRRRPPPLHKDHTFGAPRHAKRGPGKGGADRRGLEPSET